MKLNDSRIDTEYMRNRSGFGFGFFQIAQEKTAQPASYVKDALRLCVIERSEEVI